VRRVVLLGALLLLSASAAPLERGVLHPRVHLVHGSSGGDPMLVYYELAQPLTLKSLRVPGLPIKSWRFVTAFQKRNLEIELEVKPGLSTEWDRLEIVDGANRARSLFVAPSRALTVPERDRYEINYERMEQKPSSRLYLGLRIFNDSAQVVTIDRFIYAPSAASTNRILVHPSYDPAWFNRLEVWSERTDNTLPQGSSLLNSEKLNLKIAPSRGFSAAIVGQSFKAGFSCARAGVKRDPGKRVDSAYLQPLIQYRVGNGKPLLYPVPDAIIADLCP
jgi:hypothetical protein